MTPVTFRAGQPSTVTSSSHQLLATLVKSQVNDLRITAPDAVGAATVELTRYSPPPRSLTTIPPSPGAVGRSFGRATPCLVSLVDLGVGWGPGEGEGCGLP